MEVEALVRKITNSWLSINSPRGCVTPKQIANIQQQIGDLSDLDLDKDLDDILDGYEDLTPESQDQIKYALLNGHVHDDVWKGVSTFDLDSNSANFRRTQS